MNAALRRICPNHPHIFKFLDRLRLHEFSKSLDVLLSVDSDAPLQKLQRRRRLKCKRRMAKIAYLTEALQNNKITPDLFLEAMANERKILEIGKIIINIDVMNIVDSVSFHIFFRMSFVYASFRLVSVYISYSYSSFDN